MARRIDIHHHYFPANLDKAKLNEKLGWHTPAENLPWNEGISLDFMDAAAIDVAILSFPAIASGFVGQENRELTRALAEIAYGLDVLNADGISLSSSYGEGANATYIGDARYDPIWVELNRRAATVFLHGAQTPSSTPHPHSFLGVPITEVPSETFKAAAHLVVTGRKRKYRACRIILAHLGGSTPFLAARVAVLSRHMGCPLSSEEILEDFKNFYYETALSAHQTTLSALDTFVDPERILFGTDFPAVSSEMVGWYTRNLEAFHAADAHKLASIMANNALDLFPKFRTADKATLYKL
ncbi:Amidohydrolase 2 [Mycena sanguinolenta]|uniref:6-methylsalicylate decarboxylase n=1 Tax=Mycena sanguinolenta TaxID=230812 RepID=A0A8H6YC63_9AGAR|nr:Amidohydrolase 2 [Mycena sanguinolenta]